MIITPPYRHPLVFSRSWIFLAGSIENGTAEKWQDKVIEDLHNKYHIMNPRKDNWNSEVEQKFEDSEFSQQVNWELNMIDRCDIIMFHFDPSTKSPISLMELGLVIGKEKKEIYVSCPKDFWRKGNVDILCDRYKVPVFDSLDECIKYLK